MMVNLRMKNPGRGGGMMCRIKKASVTVEAALVLPMLIIFSLQLFSAFEMMTIYCRMETALGETAGEVATFLYAMQGEQTPENSLLISETFVREEMIRKVGLSEINNSVITGGILGLSLFRCDVAKDGENVDLILTYLVSPRYSVGLMGNMTLVNHCQIKAWNGYEKSPAGTSQEEETETVYVTGKGKAYHLYRNCSYLMTDTECILSEEVEGRRNEDGGKYYACELCSKGVSMENTDVCYIATWGNRYHVNPACSALFKNVSEISIKDVGNRHLCSRCAARQGKED